MRRMGTPWSRGCPILRASGDAGAVLAELAIVLPLVTLLTLGVIQLSLLGYASVMARYAAFAGVRAAAVASTFERTQAAVTAVAGVLAAVPVLRVLSVEIARTPLALRGAELGHDRMTCRVLVSVPRLIPLRYASTVSSVCALPMEPVW